MTWLRAAFVIICVVIAFLQIRAFKRDMKRTLQQGHHITHTFDTMLRRHLSRMILLAVVLFIGAILLSRLS